MFYLGRKNKEKRIKKTKRMHTKYRKGEKTQDNEQRQGKIYKNAEKIVCPTRKGLLLKKSHPMSE